MPQLLGWIVAGVAVWAGYKWLRGETRRVAEKLREADETLDTHSEKSVPKLERDPETGVYKPADE
ncbi:MAG: hypothetical protein OEM91_01385 [Hyphomicrobiales bacterium]|nr:hypothetical protein [Hyphomicrobiales bacterium]